MNYILRSLHIYDTRLAPRSKVKVIRLVFQIIERIACNFMLLVFISNELHICDCILSVQLHKIMSYNVMNARKLDFVFDYNSLGTFFIIVVAILRVGMHDNRVRTIRTIHSKLINPCRKVLSNYVVQANHLETYQKTF